MASITISVEDVQMQKLNELATSQGLSIEELLQARLHSWLNSPEKEVENATDYVLRKNADLYQRLS